MSAGLEPGLGLALVAAASFVASVVLARLAPRLGWTDAPRGADAARKLQRRAVPAVGGVALLFVLAPGGALVARSEALWAPHLPGEAARWTTLAALFLVGAFDDRRPLAPGPKSLAQLAALLPLALAGSSAGLAWSLAWLALGFLFVNVLNTFDNADGALALLCLVGFAPISAPVSAALAGFLPLNLDAQRAANRASRAPTVYLGDAGAFLLATLVLWRPEALGLLWLPLLDLVRLTWVRWRAGSKPWLGDRRHLAHRLQGRGAGPVTTAALLAGIALPALVGVPAAFQPGRGALAGVGLTLTFVLFLVALWRAPDPLPCPRAPRSE